MTEAKGLYIPSLEGDRIRDGILSLACGDDEAVMILVANAEAKELEGVVAGASETAVEFFGGLFPGLIVNTETYEQGALLVKFKAVGPPLVIEGVDEQRAFELNGSRQLSRGLKTAIVLVDGLTTHISALLAELHVQLGEQVKFIGGGAGTLALKQRPCVFTRHGLVQNAAVVLFSPQSCRLGVRHGWERHFGPLVVTRANGNTIEELNWQPAIEVYREALGLGEEDELTPDNFFETAMSYPFGLWREGREDIVRDPLVLTETGALTCVGEVPENAVVHILHGDNSTLLAAADRVGRDARSEEDHAGLNFVVDCVSRTLFLKESFEEELRIIKEKLKRVDADVPVELYGVLTLGEISSHGERFLEFLNKTIVVATFE